MLTREMTLTSESTFLSKYKHKNFPENIKDKFNEKFRVEQFSIRTSETISWGDILGAVWVARFTIP